MSDIIGNLNGNKTLKCPNCESRYLHQRRVEVFSREAARADNGNHVEVRHNDGISIDRSMEGNPSGRRDGVKITFECEICSGSHVLRIAQHEGNERISWETDSE